MKYYKKENVEREIVEEYKITKLKCDYCGKMIEEGDEYAEICEIPESFKNDIVYKDICPGCFLNPYINSVTYKWAKSDYPKIEVEMMVFKSHNERYVDEEKDVEEIDAETN